VPATAPSWRKRPPHSSAPERRLVSEPSERIRQMPDGQTSCHRMPSVANLTTPLTQLQRVSKRVRVVALSAHVTKVSDRMGWLNDWLTDGVSREYRHIRCEHCNEQGQMKKIGQESNWFATNKITLCCQKCKGTQKISP